MNPETTNSTRYLSFVSFLKLSTGLIETSINLFKSSTERPEPNTSGEFFRILLICSLFSTMERPIKFQLIHKIVAVTIGFFRMADNIVDYIVIDIIDNILNRVIMAVKGFAVNHRLFCKLSHRDFGNIFFG